MKNLFSVLFSACLITLFSAFTLDLNNTSKIEAESVIEKVLTTQNGQVKACWIAERTSTLTYRLDHQGTAATITANATCDFTNLQLECGEWDVYLEINGSDGAGFFEYEFQNTSGSFQDLNLGNGIEKFVGQMQIF